MRYSARQTITTAAATISVVAFAWTVVVFVTGGFEVVLFDRRISSRNPHNPWYVSLLCAGLWWLLSTPAQRRSAGDRVGAFYQASECQIARLPARLRSSIPIALALAAAVSVTTVGIRYGSRAAGGADTYGYVSQAHLWVSGLPRVPQPFAKDMRWGQAPESLSPLGYRVADDGSTLVPMFPPGLPMLMSAFERVGGMDAVFYVVPLLAGLAVVATYFLGRHLAGRVAGAAAAVWLATSPPFLLQSILAMTDVPVAAFWAIGLAFLTRRSSAAALAAGLAASAAILTRPNLAPLVLPPVGLLLWQAWRGADDRVRRLVAYGLGLGPGIVGMAFINNSLYGSPFVTGLGPAGSLFSLSYFSTNLSHYPLWMVQVESPLILLALAAPAILARTTPSEGSPTAPAPTASMWLGFAGAVFACYLFYWPNGSWPWLRYILPAFPAVLALTAATLVILCRRVPHRLGVPAVALIVSVVAWRSVDFTLENGLLGTRDGEARVIHFARYVADSLPSNGVFIGDFHSGSIRHYAGRLTVRWGAIPADELDHALAELRRLGYHPYFAFESGEDAEFQAKFRGHSAMADLDWPPVAVFERETIFDAAGVEPRGVGTNGVSPP